VLAFVVARRTRETGIRVALGWGRASVVRLVLQEMFAVVLVGLVAGGVAAWLAGSTDERRIPEYPLGGLVSSGDH
jgi:ABC-type antimicrobial peptide transport system permease subunit